MKKRIVIALGHRALGTTLPEQKKAVKTSAAVLADMVEEGYQLVITHSNAPQVGMIHTAMNEFGKNASRLHSRSDVRMLRHEPGLHRLRPAECGPCRAFKTRHLQNRIYDPDTGDR